MKYLGKIHNIGKILKITELLEVRDDFFVGKNRYILLDKTSYIKLKELDCENELFYPKGEEVFSMDKVVSEKVDPLFHTKYKIKNAIANSFKNEFSNLDLFSFLRFVGLSAELSDKGHYLYIDNLDEKLEEIASLNNKNLLEKAQSLAEVIRDIEPKMSGFTTLIKLKKDIDKCSTEDQIKEVIEKNTN